MERSWYADKVPKSAETAAVPYDLVKGFTKKEMTASFYHTLEKKGGYGFGGAQQTESAMLAVERMLEY